MKPPPFDAIIFDLDGTLIDTETADYTACKLLFQEFGATLTLEYWAARIVGIVDGYDELFDELIQWSHNGITKADLSHQPVVGPNATRFNPDARGQEPVANITHGRLSAGYRHRF